MKKSFLKKATSLVLAAIMATSTTVSVFANPLNSVPHNYVNDVAYVSLRQAADAHGHTVEWDGENQAVNVSDPYGNVRTISVNASGGFNNNGRVYIPLSYAANLFAVVQADTGHGLMSLNILEDFSENLPYRIPFSYREQEAALWIQDQLLAMGFDTNSVILQEFTDADVDWFCPFNYGWELAEQLSYEGGIPLRQDRTSQNVILTIPGQSDSIIIVGAHYDSYLSAGANDNASGVALLMESAYRMQNANNYHTIVYVFFGAEEVGMWGARYFYDSLTAQERDNITLMINVDGIVGGTYLMYSAAMGAGPGFEVLPFIVEAIAADISSQMAELYEQMELEMLLSVLGLGGMGIETLEQLIEIVIAINSDIPPVAVFDMWEAIPTPVTAQIDAIADTLNEQANTGLIGIPNGIITPTDQLVFLMEGHTVLYFAGITRIPESNMEFLLAQENHLFGHFIHTASDTFEYIEATNPGKMQNNLRAFSLLLEEILLAQFN